LRRPRERDLDETVNSVALFCRVVSEDATSRLARELTGLVADGFGVQTSFSDGCVRCSRCGTALGAGDAVAALLREYEGHTWEPVTFRCPEHAPDDLASLTGIHADDQALVSARLEPTGYHDPLGEFHPDALTLGGLTVEEFSPARDGYR
jgi:hypothetical protein